MLIWNDALILDAEIPRIREAVSRLKKTRIDLTMEMNKLHDSGFRDSKFIELKKAIDDAATKLAAMEQRFTAFEAELKSRADIIKAYNSVKL